MALGALVASMNLTLCQMDAGAQRELGKSCAIPMGLRVRHESPQIVDWIAEVTGYGKGKGNGKKGKQA